MTFASRPDLTVVVDVHMHHCSTRITAECYSGMLRWPMSWRMPVRLLCTNLKMHIITLSHLSLLQTRQTLVALR